MYALVSLWQLPETPLETLRSQIDQHIVQFVRQSPGFVEGFWTYERANGKSMGFTLLDTAEHAHDLRIAIENRLEAENDSEIHLEMIRVHKLVTHMSVEEVAVATA